MATTATPFKSHGNMVSYIAPVSKSFVVVPSDTDELPNVVRELLCLADGDVVYALRDDDDSLKITRTLVAGDSIVGLIRKVFSTGTTATLRGQY